MNPRIYLRRYGLERNSFLKVCLSGAVLANAVAGAAAAEILAGAQISGVSLGHAKYAYTLTLRNTAASTSEIGMFWFAWEAGQADFLLSEPTSVQTPSGWTAVVEGGGAGDGYSIQFVTYTNPLKPGSSVTFTFDSTDSPAIISGPAVLYPEYATLTSQVYSSHFASGLQQVFIATLLPTDLGRIQSQISGDKLLLSWPSATNVVLQQSTSLTSANWTTVPGTLGLGKFTVTNAVVGASAFYRLATQ